MTLRVHELTPRELQVAQLAARGISNRRIGETLVIAVELGLASEGSN
jgi:DNA-binding NarL/FixJ family response regulator